LPLSLLISAQFIWFVVKLFSRFVAQDLCHDGQQKLLQQPTFRDGKAASGSSLAASTASGPFSLGAARFPAQRLNRKSLAVAGKSRVVSCVDWVVLLLPVFSLL
jgi:hypothetical protein